MFSKFNKLTRRLKKTKEKKQSSTCIDPPEPSTYVDPPDFFVEGYKEKEKKKKRPKEKMGKKKPPSGLCSCCYRYYLDPIFFYLFIYLHPHEIIVMLYFHCSLCVCVSVCVSVCQWTKFQQNGCTDLDAIFVKWLLTALAQTFLKLVIFGWKSRSQWVSDAIKKELKVTLTDAKGPRWRSKVPKWTKWSYPILHPETSNLAG